MQLSFSDRLPTFDSFTGYFFLIRHCPSFLNTTRWENFIFSFKFSRAALLKLNEGETQPDTKHLKTFLKSPVVVYTFTYVIVVCLWEASQRIFDARDF